MTASPDWTEPVRERRLDPSVRSAAIAVAGAGVLLAAALAWPLDAGSPPPPTIRPAAPPAGGAQALRLAPFDPRRRAIDGVEPLPIRIDKRLEAKVPMATPPPVLAGLLGNGGVPLALFDPVEDGWKRTGDIVLGWTIEEIGGGQVLLSRNEERATLDFRDALVGR